MFGLSLLMVVAFGLVVFMVNRLYVGFSRREITVKGITYIRSGDAFQFWFVMLMATCGLCFGLFILVGGTALLLDPPTS